MLGVFVKSDKLGDPRMTIILQGPPCSYGKCRFCPFAVEQSIRVRDIIKTNNIILDNATRILREASRDITRISIFNGGSFTELPFDTVYRLAMITKGRIVDVELIPPLVKPDLLLHIKHTLQAKKLVVRTGFEVFDEKLRYMLGKEFSNDHLYDISNALEELHKRGINVVSYVLFGIEGISEDKVVESVIKFNQLLDGAICVRYKNYGAHMPREKPVSHKLARFLEKNCILVDWTENEEWVFQYNPTPAHVIEQSQSR